MCQSVAERHLIDRQNGISGPGTPEDLQEILNELRNITQVIQSGNIPPKGSRWVAYPLTIITDTWEHGTILGEKLCDLADKYQRKLS